MIMPAVVLPQDDKTSADYYFDSYSHFGKIPASGFGSASNADDQLR